MIQSNFNGTMQTSSCYTFNMKSLFIFICHNFNESINNNNNKINIMNKFIIELYNTNYYYTTKTNNNNHYLILLLL